MKPFTTLAAIFFAMLSLGQLVRFFYAWPISINGYSIPVWASAVAFVVAGALSVMVWRERRP